MNLIVDIGNTSTKLAVYEGREKLSVSRINELSCEELENELKGFKIKKAIVSSVRNLPPYIKDLIFANIPFVHVLSYKSRLPFRIGYETPETLGTDRIAAVAGAFNLFPGAEILIIDAGSAITFDFLSVDLYKGGNISPGIEMRFKALNKFTEKLPLATLSDHCDSPGQNTTGLYCVTYYPDYGADYDWSDNPPPYSPDSYDPDSQGNPNTPSSAYNNVSSGASL